MYNNETAGPAFEEFLDLLGQRVRLKGFSKYRAQLDNKSKFRAACPFSQAGVSWAPECFSPRTARPPPSHPGPQPPSSERQNAATFAAPCSGSCLVTSGPTVPSAGSKRRSEG